MVLLFLGARFFLAGGKERFAAVQEDRRDAISILKAQLIRVESKLETLEKQVDDMTESELWNREYRHALANQNHILLAWYSLQLEMLRDAARIWRDMPEELKTRIARLKEPNELLKDVPLPAPQVKAS
ncbi:hypothetical protein EON80_30430 [bacterium]|nr:MAG: hypothetical protein EON80_30430 [bacterium]